MQTPREVVDSLLRNRPAERYALLDHPWDDAMRKWVAEEGYPVDTNGDAIAAVDHFGFDCVSVGGWFDSLPKRGFSEVLEETDEWEIVRNGSGGVLKEWKHKSGTPEHIDFHMTSREIWDAEYRPHLLDFDRGRLGDMEAMKKTLAERREQGLWTFYGNLFIWECMRRSMGDVCMLESLLLDPDWIHDYGRVHTDLYKAHYAAIFEEAGLPDGIWIYEDLGYRNGLFCRPEVLGELIFPYYAEMVEFFHSYDLPVVLHSCGGITEGIPLVVDAGFDALNPMEAKAGCDLLQIAKDYGDKLAFFGGVDARLFESGDQPLIRREVTRLVQGMKDVGARWVFGSDHSISTNVVLADLEYAFAVFREQMMLG